MKLVTKKVAGLLPPLYSTESSGGDAMATVKFFTPWGGWTWWAKEYDPAEGMFFGLVYAGPGNYPEYGYFSLADLESVKGPFGLKIERDINWSPRPIGEILEEVGA